MVCKHPSTDGVNLCPFQLAELRRMAQVIHSEQCKNMTVFDSIHNCKASYPGESATHT